MQIACGNRILACMSRDSGVNSNIILSLSPKVQLFIHSFAAGYITRVTVRSVLSNK